MCIRDSVHPVFFRFQEQVLQGFQRIAADAAGPRKVIAGTGRNITEAGMLKVLNSLQHLIDRSISANDDQMNFLLITLRAGQLLGQPRDVYKRQPLPYVKKMYYLDVNFYRYYIGRSDQSVNEKVMIGRIDQQLKVNRLMVDYFTSKKQALSSQKKLRSYMINYLDIITTVSSIMLICSDTEENLEKKDELWKYIKQKDRMLFFKLRYGLLGSCTNLPGKSGRCLLYTS